MNDSKQLLAHDDLKQFHGSEQIFSTWNRKVVYTEGVRYLAETAEAYWLIDAIASYSPSTMMEHAMEADSRLLTLQFWRLEVAIDQTATLSARVDKGITPFIVQKIPFTDFPLDYVDIWAGFSGKHWTLYLPSEH